MQKNSRIVAIDFDGTIAAYVCDKKGYPFGKPMKGVKSALQKLKKNNCIIIIHSCRNENEDIKKYLEEHSLAYDYINYNPINDKDWHSQKPLADIYIDDKGLTFNGKWDNDFIDTIMNFKAWHK